MTDSRHFCMVLMLLVGCVDSYSLGQHRLDGGTDSDPDSAADGGDECFVGGCSGQLCSDMQGVASTCEWNEVYACYRSATCERQPGGQCDWTTTPELTQCIANGGPLQMPDCYVVGCSSQHCSADPGLTSTCESLPEYACYQTAECTLQTDGMCGWTPTSALTQCIAEARR